MKARTQWITLFWTALSIIAVTAAEFHPIDLSGHILRPWGSFQPFSDWTFPAGGRQLFNGVPFDISGCVQLTGMEHAQKGSFRPPVQKFAIEHAFTQVHLLHYTEFSSTFGQPVARLVLHYDSGEPYAFPLLFGVHCMDWYHNPSQPAASGETTTCVWLVAPADGRSRQVTGIWHTAVPNPNPTKKVKAIEIQSMFAKSTYTLLGLTLEQGEDKPALVEKPPAGRRFPQVVMPPSRRVQCVDASTGRPLGSAKAAVSLRDGDKRIRWGEYECDAEGRLSVLLSPWGYYGLEITAATSEHMPTYFAVEDSLQSLASTNETAVLKLQRGKTIGGLVRDAVGHAVSNATVSITSVEGAPGRFALFNWPLARTDALGRWSLTSAGENFRGLEIRITHPKYLPVEYEQGDGSEPFHVTAAQLFKGEAIMQLEGGVTVSGRVLDNGRAITNARIACFVADDGNVHRGAATDTSGHYMLSALERGDIALMAFAPGHSPVLLRRKVEADTNLDIELKPAEPLRVKVQSTDGQPIAEAWLVLLEWQGFRPLDRMYRTDPRGTITCDDAPADGAKYLVTAMGGSSEIRALPAGADISVVTLRGKSLR